MPGIKGSLIGLKINGVFVSCEVSCDFSTSIDMLPASAVTSGRWKEFIQGIRSWTMSVNGRLLLEAVGADAKTILVGIDSGLPFFLQFATKASASSEFILSGVALPQNLNISAGNIGKANWNAVFQGSGPLTTTFEDYDLIINAMPIESDYPIIVNTNVI